MGLHMRATQGALPQWQCAATELERSCRNR